MKKNSVSRELEINTLLEIINYYKRYQENSKNGLVILVNGPWGSGKTTVLESLENEIKNDETIELLAFYKSWESDYFENAYLPFFYQIEDRFSDKFILEKIASSVHSVGLNQIMKILGKVIGKVILSKSGIDSTDFKTISGEIVAEYKKETLYLEEYKEFLTLKKKIIEQLNKICLEDKKYVFIIDELDRCNPKFAVDTLEIIKHFFDIKNCIFIVSVDKLQLGESIKTIFGQNMNSEIYFSKFFDYQFNLPKISFGDLVENCEIDNKEEILEYLEYLFRKHLVSTRDSLKIFSEFLECYNNNKKHFDFIEQQMCIIFLLTLKYTNLYYYNAILNGNINTIFMKNQSKDPTFTSISDSLGFRDGVLNNFLATFNQYYDVIPSKELRICNDSLINDKYKKQHAAYTALNKYIPLIRENISYKKIIEKIIN